MIDLDKLPQFYPLRYPFLEKKNGRSLHYVCGYCKKKDGHNARTCSTRQYDEELRGL